MTKTAAPDTAMSIADKVTYGIVAAVVGLGILAFFFLQ